MLALKLSLYYGLETFSQDAQPPQFIFRDSFDVPDLMWGCQHEVGGGEDEGAWCTFSPRLQSDGYG